MNKTKPILNSDGVLEMHKGLCKLHERFGVMWALGVATGLRISDLLSLRVRDIKQITWVQERKTGRIRGLFVPLSVRNDIEALAHHCRLAPSDFLFYSSAKKKDKPISRQWAHRIIARMASNLRQKCVGAHSMRKTYACNLYRATGSIEAVQTDLGHKSISTTFFYIRDALERQPSG